MTPRAHAIAVLLGGPRVRPAGAGWLTCCPAHQDDTPSLRVADGETRVVFHCYGGCSSADVARAVQARHGEALRGPAPAPRTRGKFVYRTPGASAPKLKPLIEWSGPTEGPGPHYVPMPSDFCEKARYAWHTKDGAVHHWVVRGENKSGEKVFVPMSKWRSAKGEGWMSSMPPGLKPLYDSHLDDGQKPILFVEGEKAAEAAKRIFGNRFWITTAGSWSRLGGTDLEPLGWRDITVSPDLDSPGLGMAAALAGIVGRPVTVMIPPPEAWPKNGVGCDLADLEGLHGTGLAAMAGEWLYSLGGGAGAHRRIRIIAVDNCRRIRDVASGPGSHFGEMLGMIAEADRASDRDRAHINFHKFDFVPDPRIVMDRIQYTGNYAILV